MSPSLIEVFSQSLWELKSVRILLFFLIALIVSRLGAYVSRRLVKLGRFASPHHRPRPERESTLQGLFASAITIVAFLGAVVASIGLYVDFATLIWIIGLFSAAFGLGARPIISDFMAGISFIFEDTFAVGEKVEFLNLEGIIEAINLRTTWMRSPTGELYVIPNGEIRTVRNFSRGRFSTMTVTIKIAAADLGRALSLLEELGHEAVMTLPNLLEPWQVLSESGVIGQQTELMLLAKARFGKAAEMRPRLLAMVHEHLAEAQIELVN